METVRVESDQTLSERIAAVLKAIPYGKIASYGQVAALAGNPRAARQVVRILNAWSRSRGLPWHRVVNREGRISLPPTAGGREQRDLLEGEGVSFGLDGRIDLARHRWSGLRDEAGRDA